MNIQENISLKEHSTMRLGGNARYLVDIDSAETLVKAMAWANEKNLPTRMIGGGNNIVWRDEGYDGLLLVNKIIGREIINQDSLGTIVKIGAGENWDDVVAWAVENGWSGIESLSLIPGSTGATPIQNVGAYGTEISQTLVELEAYDTHSNEFVVIAGKDCCFCYRTSRFKSSDAGRYLIINVTLKLLKQKPKPPFYEDLQKYFEEQDVEHIDLAALRQAVINIRSSKLPDPAHVANNGSFFANPIICTEHFESLKAKYPSIKAWPYEDKFKLAAGWLVEQAGFKGIHDKETGMGVWPQQSLVLVNEHAKTTADLLKFKQKIVDAVKEKFSVELEQEPELLP